LDDAFQALYSAPCVSALETLLSATLVHACSHQLTQKQIDVADLVRRMSLEIQQATAAEQAPT
jgi:hypothetical protein